MREDHEIFDLVSAIEAAEGKGTTFYSWLDVPASASTAQIAKAYRKKSIQLQCVDITILNVASALLTFLANSPDKNKGVKNAHERFARLGVVSAILRKPESRKRYDFFYKNGVPKWRGTGYYYSRFRPGLGTVLVFLTLVSSVLQYQVQRLNYRRDLKRIEWIIDQARSAAWGSKMIPLDGQRKVKVNLGGGSRLDEDGNVVGGKMVDMIVEGNSVYILESDGGMITVDSNTAVAPSLKTTWFPSLVIHILGRVTKRGTPTDDGPTDNGDAGETEDGSATTSDVPGSGAVTPKEGTAPALKNGRIATTMAGGRRRKAVKKR
ncbi:putative J domain-containing protein C2E1P5.03 [Grifola frondosa]|uniref:Putative J domain-containing protein C2E1P5.03 n=1 Tax=Grifola frondosa TaxID=5627 RepID=A0A1C7M0D8_GRIFR|nr:putative J domain-containing protein C2E1P5.03 [Grifola frondosa]